MSDLGKDVLICGYLDSLFSSFNDLSMSFVTDHPESVIPLIPNIICELLFTPICILWKLDEKTNTFKVLAASDKVDEAYRKTELDFGHPGVQHILPQNFPIALSDINDSSYRLRDIDEIKARSWKSVMSMPFRSEGGVTGIIDVFTTEERSFYRHEMSLLKILSNYISSVYNKSELIQEKKDREKLEELTNIMLKMAASNEVEEVWDLLFEGVTRLISCKYVSIACLNQLTGELTVVRHNSEAKDVGILDFGRGIISEAIKQERLILASNVLSKEWAGRYYKRWPDTISELAVPLVDNVLVRKGTEVILGTKVFGVINLESETINAFSQKDIDRILAIARLAAIRFERLEFYRKNSDIRIVEKEISKKANYERNTNYDEIIEIIIRGIRSVLQFDWINISIVDPERTRIKTEYVEGIPKSKKTEFMAGANHLLTSNDIQADIVRTKNIEVPPPDDPRFDMSIFNGFGYKDYIRVYLPMIGPSINLVIGTVEAGYKRESRKYIYEQDVQILKGFVDDAVHALERKKSGLIDRITHELKSPIIGIRSNTSYVQRNLGSLGANKITLKLEDILTDCDLLFYQVRQMEYFLGKAAFLQPRLIATPIFKDVIIKTVNQLKPLLDEYGYPIKAIDYVSSNTIVMTDKAMLNQVIYNLLMNAIKYAKDEADEFKVSIRFEENKDYIIICFQDYGIGINEEDKYKIFQEGFRSDEAIAKNIGGSGLGLNISKTIMNKLGGDLILRNPRNPTEFAISLPNTKAPPKK